MNSPKPTDLNKKKPLLLKRYFPIVSELPDLSPSNVPVLEAYVDNDPNQKRMMAPKSKLFEPTIARSLNYTLTISKSENYNGQRKDPPLNNDDDDSDDSYDDDSDFVFPLITVTKSQPISPKMNVKFRLRDFLEASPEGATLLIPEGIYEENLVLRKRCNLIAKGKVELRGISGKKEPTITITGQGITLTGFKIKSPNDALALSCIGYSCQLENCVIESTENPSIYINTDCFASLRSCDVLSVHNHAILSDSGMIEMQNSTIRDSLDEDSVFLKGSSIAKFVECKFTNCSKNAIKVNDTSVLILDTCNIETCGENGVFFANNSMTTRTYINEKVLYDTNYQKNGRSRQRTRKPKPLVSTIIQASIVDCGGSGIYCSLLSALNIIGCEITECRKNAIVLNDGCGCVMKNNVIYRCGGKIDPMLLVLENASLYAQGDKYIESGLYTVFLTGNAKATMNRIKFNDIKGTALMSSGNSSLRIEDSSFQSIDGYGLYFESQGNALLKNCEFNGCQMGLVCDKCSNIEIYSCNFEECRNSGCQLLFVENFTLHDSSFVNNQECGLLLQNSTNCSLNNISCTGNSFSGIDCIKSQLAIDKCLINENLMGGVYLRSNTTLSPSKDMRIENNGVIGLALESKSIASLQNSEITNNSGRAFTVVRQSVLTITSSRITNHNDVAIQVEGRASKLILDSSFVEHNKIALVSSDSAIVNVKSTSFNDNYLNTELREGASMKCQFSTFTTCNGPLSVHVLSNSSLSLITCTMKENSGICLACASNVAVSFCHFINNKGPIGIMLYTQNASLGISGGSVDSNGEAGIYVKEGSLRGSDTKIANHSCVGILISSKGKADISDFLFSNNGLMNINRE